MIKIEWIGGNCPVQAEGTVDGQPFYFRARGNHWSMSIGEPSFLLGGLPAWYHEEQYGDANGQYSAGWMTEDEARTFIDKAVGFWRAEGER